MAGIAAVLLPAHAARSEPAWTASGTRARANFGDVVSLGDADDDGYADAAIRAAGLLGTGIRPIVFFYRGGPAGLQPVASWTLGSESVFHDQGGVSQLGHTLSLAGDLNGDKRRELLVGAPGAVRSAPPAEDCSSIEPFDSGVTLVFFGAEKGLQENLSSFSRGDCQQRSEFGRALATGLDVDRDGLDDVLVGAPRYSLPGSPPFPIPGTDDAEPGGWQGKAYFYRGTPGGLEETASWTSHGDRQPALGYGGLLELADVNDDGHADAIVGTTAFPCNDQYECGGLGKVYVYFGSDAGLPEEASWSVTGSHFGATESSSLHFRRALDLDGDAFDDLVVTAAGAVHIIPGTPAGPELDRAWTFDRAGIPVATGDFDGDGGTDWVAAEVNGYESPGRIDLYLGREDGSHPLEPTTSLTGTGQTRNGQQGARLGESIAVGDVNGDGYDDILAGEPGADIGEHHDAGKAYLWLGADTPSGVCAPPGTPCDDGDSCTENDACTTGGLCRGTPACADAGIDAGPITGPDGAVADAGGKGPRSDAGEQQEEAGESGSPPGGADADTTSPGTLVSSGCGCHTTSSSRSRDVLALAAVVLTAIAVRRSR